MDDALLIPSATQPPSPAGSTVDADHLGFPPLGPRPPAGDGEIESDRDADAVGLRLDLAETRFNGSGAPAALPIDPPPIQPLPEALAPAATGGSPPAPPPPRFGAERAAVRRQAYEGWLHRVARAPWAVDLFQALRHIESAHPELPRLGCALRPADEPVRIGQPAEFTFAPATVSGLVLRAAGGAPPQLQQRAFGLLGPNGPLPLHLTELARERANVHADAVLQRFLDTLTHRFALLFYRAWAQAQPALGLDRPGHPDFARWLGALSGIGNETQTRRDAVGDAAKLHFTGRLGRQVRDADGLLAWCQVQFDVPVRIEQWSPHWMALAADERTRLRGPGRAAGLQASRHTGTGGAAAQGLGRGAVLGASVWDVQHKFRIVIGPLQLARYQAFLPGGRDLPRLQAMVRQWSGLEFEWDLRLILARADVPAARLGAAAGSPGPLSGGARANDAGSLGRTAWLGRYRRSSDACDLVIDVERVLHRRRRQQRPSAHRPPPD